ncbi:hypothetical protein Ctob_016341 [Chrysochromulina tobinii]|uniref:Uncharacterized protein n=1 Tax=Chrysochromulina tobinii TaxID=1460289 RepID=A0A0M0K636_9EUKA|nr:hypothetical protein Ctob_016341 [Chrysochromulina tobinii]|eukprot:KOO34047.1 hypothetical protein Ctob_016341 [Chrysochromulina sp. CCMP291]
MYIDDAGLVSIDDDVFDSSGAPVMRNGVQLTRAWAHFEILKASLAEMGLETTKEQPPSSVLTLLGVEINLDTRRMRVSDDKRVKYAERARTVAALTVVGRDEFLGLLGRLNFAATFYPRGRQWLHAPWRAVRAQYRTAADQVVISKAVREQLRLWVAELGKPDHEGVPIGAAEAFPAAASPEVSAIYADAALECAGAGFCAWTVDGDELLYVQGEWSSAERESYLGKYLSHVRMWHRQEFFRDIIGDDYGQLKELLKGIARTVTQPPKLERWGVRTQDLAASMQASLNPASAVDSNWFAALTCAFCGLLRAAEFSLQPGETFDPAKHLTRADVTFVTEADGSEYAVIALHAAQANADIAATIVKARIAAIFDIACITAIFASASARANAGIAATIAKARIAAIFDIACITAIFASASATTVAAATPTSHFDAGRYSAC